MFTELLLQSDSPKTDVYHGLAVAVLKKAENVFFTDVHMSRTHLLAICLQSDKRCGKLPIASKRRHVALAAPTSQSAVVSWVVQHLC